MGIKSINIDFPPEAEDVLRNRVWIMVFSDYAVVCWEDDSSEIVSVENLTHGNQRAPDPMPWQNLLLHEGENVIKVTVRNYRKHFYSMTFKVTVEKCKD